YVYINRDDTLVVESREDRKGTRDLKTVTITGGFLLKEDGDFLLKEDGDKLIIDAAESVSFDNTMTDLEIEYGHGIINEANATVFPRKVGTLGVLFTLEQPIRIPAGVPIVVKGKYSDPVGGNPIHGTNMQTPTTPTDYLLTADEDGGGADLSASLTVGANFYADGVEFTLNSTVTGWLFKCNARGNSITKYNPVQSLFRDVNSINAYGTNSISIRQTYQDTIEVAQTVAEAAVESEREPDVEATAVRFMANESEKQMQAFLNLDVGDLVHIIEDKNEIDAYYYIYAVEYEITQGGIIDFAYRIKRTRSLQNGLTAIAIEFDGSSDEVVRFPAVPQMLGIEKTIIMQINLDVLSAGDKTILQITDGETLVGFNLLSIAGDPVNALLFQAREFEDDWLQYLTDNDTIAAATDYTVGVSYDSGSIYNRPTLYINGVKTAARVAKWNSGTRKETNNAFRVNVGSTDLGFDDFDGKIKNIRHYNRILSDTEHLFSHTGIVADGMVFQVPNVISERLADYIDQSLAESDKIVDNVFGVVGTPLNTPTGRTA
ncbi:hypothetical protein LCGC14_0607570, partial [marine sediment metagenome]